MDLIPGRADLWFLPLGGTGEIGMNLNLYGHAGFWLMVDCGVTFNSPLQPDSLQKADVVAADPAFIARQPENLAGIVITHAHEDHIGALPALWPRLKCPVYATAFTAEILRRKLAEVGLLDKVPIIEVKTGDTRHIGPFAVQFLSITHSIPEPHCLMIRTDAGSVFHTADWKIDATPMTGRAFKPRVFQRLAVEKVTAMVCDSTNALREGFSVSETDCYNALLQVISQAQARVVVSGFSSNVGRLIALGRVANKTGRYMALLGRSLQNMVGAARATGHWPDDIHLIDANDLGYLPKEEVLVVATGSQGEPKATLSRLAADMQRELSLESGDLVIFSSIIIPGNEGFIEKLVQQFQQRDIQTLQSHNTDLPIHVSGHPCRGELELLYSWVKPQIAVPVHGEAAHIEANADVARQSQVPIQLTGLNGDLYVLAPEPRIYKQVVKTGRIALIRS